jgi:hypothetical protein
LPYPDQEIINKYFDEKMLKISKNGIACVVIWESGHKILHNIL